MMRSFRSAFLIVFVTLCVFGAADLYAQETRPARISYRLAMSRPASHLFEVQIEVEADRLLREDHVDFQMPAWSPGRYGVFDFAKNVQDVRASSTVCESENNCHSASPTVTRLDGQTWRVGTVATRTVTFSYRVFGNDLSGTFSKLEERHANFNGGSIFMYVVGHKPEPVSLEIDPPKDWRIVNGYSTSRDQRHWQFANFDLLIDTPTVIGPDWTMDEFKVGEKNYRVVVTSLGPDGGKRPELVGKIQRIVQAQTTMWGPPECDNYTFLITLAADDESGDAMEHLTSTNIVVPGALADDGTLGDVLGAVSHEFFHTWNGKRLRPAELGPWDFTRPVNTRGLWIYEGITNYYTPLMMRRAGLITEEELLDQYAQTIGQIENAPGNRQMSAEESSLTASYQDGAAHAQKTNFANNSINYYPKGETLGFVLDLIIRGKTNGKATLDDVLKRLYQDLYMNSPAATYYLRGRGYTRDDFIKAVSGVVGADMQEFFTRHVAGKETAPYNEALRPFGLRLNATPALPPSGAGILFQDGEDDAVKLFSVDNDSAAEDAGLSAGDIITEVGGQPVTATTFRLVFGKFRTGDTVAVTYKRDRRTLKTSLVIKTLARNTYAIQELPNATPAEKALRAAWLRSVIPN